MPILVRLIEKYAIYLYVICGLILLPFLSEFQRARRDRQSIFPLEKENATKRLRRTSFGIVLVLGIAAGVYYISSYAGPSLVELQETPTSTPTTSLLFPTPTPQLPTPAPTTNEEAPTAIFTATRRTPPTPQPVVPTDTPTPAILAPDCPNPGVRIASPSANAVLKGTVEIQGSADIETFDYYKFEFKSLSIVDEFHHVYTSKQRVSNGVLGYWNVDGLPSGEYLFQLIVVDITGNYPPPCQVRVIVEH